MNALFRSFAICALLLLSSFSLTNTFAQSGDSATPSASGYAHSSTTCTTPPPHYFSVFTRKDCVNCIRLHKYLDANFASGSTFLPKYYDIEDSKNAELFDQFTTRFSLTKTTPIILVGETIIQGFASDETTGKSISELSSAMRQNSYFEKADANCKVESSAASFACDATEGAPVCAVPDKKLLVSLPFIGVVNLKDYSLPTLSVILGFVDGFNPCAMWVLIMFLSILSQINNRRKMMQIVGIFILAETIMYYGILNAWFVTWNFIKLDSIVTPAVGVLSIGAGIFFLYEFFTSKGDECKVTSFEEKKRITKKVQEIASKPMTIGVFFATIGLAFSVNIIEFACSIGIPQTFTKLLDMSTLSLWGKQIYILIYTFFYMIDDFIVFTVAIWSFDKLHLTAKYTRFCLILGGTLMLVLGYFFLFNPAALKLLIA